MQQEERQQTWLRLDTAIKMMEDLLVRVEKLESALSDVALKVAAVESDLNLIPTLREDPFNQFVPQGLAAAQRVIATQRSK